MLDPFSYWQRVMASWQSIGTSGRRVADTASASRRVIEARSAIIGEAMRSPVTADHAELMRMVPEKIAAFSRAGEAVLQASVQIQADCWRFAQQAGMAAIGGRPPSPADWFALSPRSADYALRVFEAGARASAGAIAPVHRTATANARRLKSGTRKRG